MQARFRNGGVPWFCVLGVMVTCVISQQVRPQRQNDNGLGDLSRLIHAIQNPQNDGQDAQSQVQPQLLQGMIPTTPSPENINCYVEIVPPVRLGGVCKRMGRPNRRRGRRRRLPVTWACQAGVHLEIGSPHCSNSNRRLRNMNAAN